MEQAAPTKLRIVAFQDGDGWTAQCLEYDIAVQAPNLDTLYRRMQVALAAEAEYTRGRHGEPFAGIDPAPDYFTAVFDSVDVTVCAPGDELMSGADFRIAA